MPDGWLLLENLVCFSQGLRSYWIRFNLHKSQPSLFWFLLSLWCFCILVYYNLKACFRFESNFVHLKAFNTLPSCVFRKWNLLETKTETVLYIMHWTHRSRHATSASDQELGMDTYQWGWRSMVAWKKVLDGKDDPFEIYSKTFCTFFQSLSVKMGK